MDEVERVKLTGTEGGEFFAVDGNVYPVGWLVEAERYPDGTVRVIDAYAPMDEE